jgi:predicted transcriptional regulator
MKVHQYMKKEMNSDGFSPNKLAEALETSANLIRESLLRLERDGSVYRMLIPDKKRQYVYFVKEQTPPALGGWKNLDNIDVSLFARNRLEKGGK